MAKLLIVGGGPAGVAAAIRGAQLNAQVTLVEGQGIGGTCVNQGCIPLKTLLNSIDVSNQCRAGSSVGVTGGESSSLNLAQVVSRRDSIISYLRTGTDGILASYGITVLSGKAVLQAPNRVQVGEQILEADAIIWAAGAEYSPLPWEAEGVINLGQLLSQVDNPPESLIIFGSTTVEIEVASLFAALGSSVTLAVPDDYLLPEEDSELGQRLIPSLKESGIEILLGASIKGVQAAGKGLSVSLEAKGAVREYPVRNLALGERRPKLEGLENAAGLGLEIRQGAVVVDQRLATSLPNLFAVGDVTGGPFLSHRATAEGRIAAVNALGGNERKPKFLPNCVYTQPEIATVGLSEEQAEDQGFDVLSVSIPFETSARAYTMGYVKGSVKVVAEKEYHRLLGVHIIGPRASDLIGEACLALEMELTLEDLAAGVRAHPTLSESLGEAARALLGQAAYLPRGWV